MKERPINFRASMVRAILDGRKTQERRIVKPQPDLSERAGFIWKGYAYGLGSDNRGTQRNFARPNCPYGQPGDRLWVREAWQSLGIHEHLKPSEIPPGSDIQYPATYDRWVSKRRPSIHMPRWTSRILLEITDVRVERLQEISEADAKAEGTFGPEPAVVGGEDCEIGFPSHVQEFRHLWESDHGEGSWIENPWVWVIEFKRINQQTEGKSRFITLS